MRLRIQVSKKDKRPIPFNYQYPLASNIYEKIRKSDDSLAHRLHSSEEDKLFTFSWLDFEDGNISRGLNFSKGWFFFSSPDNEIIQALSKGLLKNPYLDIYGIKLEVDTINCLPPMELFEKARFRTLSPIYLKTLRDVSGELKSWDLFPSDEDWSKAFSNNLLNKYCNHSGVKRDHSRGLEVDTVGRFESKRIKIAGSYRRCSMLTFDIEGDRELLNFGYQVGFGEKTAMGFGCVEVVEC
jgi:CRISPR-associated endoribonuclease Cas6